jgi:S1-C subfamily serine protease
MNPCDTTTPVPYIARIAAAPVATPAKAAAEPKFLGTGICVSRREVLTCQHVVGTKKKVSITLNGQRTIAATVIAAAPPPLDLALIRLDQEDLQDDDIDPPAWSTSNVANRQSCNAVGFPGGNYEASEVEVKNAQPRYLTLEAELEPGMSGGALIRLIAGWPYCVGMLQQSSDLGVSKAISAAVVIDFLTANGVALPEQPPAPKRTPADRNRELAVYLDRLRKQTREIALHERKDLGAQSLARWLSTSARPRTTL